MAAKKTPQPSSPQTLADPSRPLLIVGLGNPGSTYQGTRHNIGQEALAELLGRAYPMPASLGTHKRTNTDIAELKLPGSSTTIIAAQLRCFMNLSGTPAQALAKFFKVPSGNIIIAHDELELPLGEVRLHRGGGDHGHNGLKSLSQALKTKDYFRLALGIGRPPGRMDPARYVLKPFPRAEAIEVPIMCADAIDLVEKLLRDS